MQNGKNMIVLLKNGKHKNKLRLQNTNALLPIMLQIVFSLAECHPIRRMTFGHLQWPLEYLTRVQTLNYHLKSKATLISIRISRAIQDLLDYLPNIPAQPEILIPQCLLTLVGIQSRLMKTYHYLQRAMIHFKHLFRTQPHPQACIRHIPLIPISFCSLSLLTATTLHSKVKPNNLKSSYIPVIFLLVA